jgi:hypothetical protein
MEPSDHDTISLCKILYLVGGTELLEEWKGRICTLEDGRGARVALRIHPTYTQYSGHDIAVHRDVKTILLSRNSPLLLNTEAHHRGENRPQLGCILSQLNPIQIFTTCLSKINFSLLVLKMGNEAYELTMLSVRLCFPLKTSEQILRLS